MSTLFHEHLCDIRREAMLRGKLEYEKEISYRLVTGVIDKIEDVKNKLREQARSLSTHVTHTFLVDISEINEAHAAYLAITRPAGNDSGFYRTISMVEAMISRRLPEEFAGLNVAFQCTDTELMFTVYADL